MEYYTLDGIEYWKYYVMLLYYRFAEMPPVVRVVAIFTTICIIAFIVLLAGNILKGHNENRRVHRIQKYDKQFKEKIIELATSTENFDLNTIIDELGLPKNYRMKNKTTGCMIPILINVQRTHKTEINRTNWQRILQAFKIPSYFEMMMRSRNTRKRIKALKNIADMDADLKEAVASRHLFSKDKKMMMNARFHVARFGTSYPFKALEEDNNLVFTDEMMVNYHNILQYRHDNNMSMPNLIRWCNRQPVNEELRIFAVNEIRLFKRHDDCPELLAMLKDCRDERFSCALIKALGELEYIPAESEFRHRYAMASFAERQALADALGVINSGNPEVVNYLVYDYESSTDFVSKMKALRVLYNYGRRGREAFNTLKAQANESTAALFEHIECKLLDSSKYA
ncbi:MAG: hypothetical protein IJ151_00345 [Bacteroidales bacterium]|nr:hypothetical protein [Bacteroidales bacterium]